MKNYYEEIKELEEKNKALSGKLDCKELMKAKKSGDMNKYNLLKSQEDNIIKQMEMIEHRIKILSICDSISKQNYKYNFVTNNLSKINSILNKYRGKRIGEKTEQKIKDEIKNISNDIQYVIIRMEYKMIDIGFTNKEKITLYSKTWFNDEEDINADCNIVNVEYSNIEEKAKELLEEKEQIENLKMELDKKIREFDRKVSFCNELYIK